VPDDSRQPRLTLAALRRSAAMHGVLYERLSWTIAAAACVVLSIRIVRLVKFSGQDSWFPMSRALDVLHGSSPGDVYQALFFSGHVKFQYPPSGLLLLELLRRIGLDRSSEYNALNAGLMIATGLVFSVFATRILGPIRCLGLRFPVAPVAFFAGIRFYPTYTAFLFGQMQVLLGLLFLLACLSLVNDKRIVAGCLIAGAASVKPQFLMLGLLALWRKDWRFLGGFAAVLAAAEISSVALYGWDTQLHYLQVLKFLSHHGEQQHLNQSINGILNRYLYAGPSLDNDPENPIPGSAFPPYIPAVYAATTLSTLIMIAIPFALRVKEDDRVSRLLGFCTATVLFTMASPIAWVHHYNILLPAYVVGLKVVLDRWQTRRDPVALIALAVSFVLTGFALAPPMDPTAPAHNLAQSHLFFGACLLVGVLLVEARSVPSGSPVRGS